MNVMSSTALRIARVLPLLALSSFCVGTTRAASDLEELTRLVEADGEEYIRLRDALLAQHADRWDVAGSAAHSWETGVAAYILNERTRSRDNFAQWDTRRPMPHHQVRPYDLSGGTPDAAAAFLLEKMWKGASDREQYMAYRQYTRARKGGFAHAGETALWKAIWEQCEDERYLFAVLYNICADPDPSVHPIIVEFLRREDDKLAGYVATGRCLAALWYRDTEETVDAILDAWDALTTKGHWKGDALKVLAVNSDQRARRIVHEFVLDAEQDATLRAETLATCCRRPHPDDPEVFRKFFAGPGSIEMKAKALKGMRGPNGYPLDPIRPLLREIITVSEEEKLVRAAALTLSRCYLFADAVDDRAVAEDIRLLEEVSDRPDLSESGQFLIRSKIVPGIKERYERFKREAEGK